jgi:hypothetical protein
MRALVLALLVALTGRADADDRARAEQYFRTGEKAFAAQNFGAAADNFEEAYKALPLPEIAFSAAQAYRRQYRVDAKPEYVRRAVALYHLYLDKVKTGGRVADAADALAEMQRELDKLSKAEREGPVVAAPPPTRLGVDVSFGGVPVRSEALREIEDRTLAMPADLVVTIDGRAVPPFALVDVPEGRHALHVAAAGYFPRDKEAVAIDGASSMIDVTLDPKPARIAIETEEGAAIDLDGRLVGSAPRAPLEVAAGAHRIAITHRGRIAIVRDLVVANDQAVELRAPLVMTARRRAVPYVTAGAGLLAVASASGAVAAYLAERDAQKILDHKNGPGNLDPVLAQKYSSDRDDRQTGRTVGWICGGAAIAAAAVAYALWQLDEPAPDAPRIAPTVSGNGGVVSVVGRF